MSADQVNAVQKDEHLDQKDRGTKRNAFSELMSASKTKKIESSSADFEQPKNAYAAHAGGSLNARDGRNALARYVMSPESFPSDIVLYQTDRFVAIQDAFPKGQVHTLLLPRDMALAEQHPLVALQNPEFLAEVRTEVVKLKKLAASELRRKLGKFSAMDQARREAMDAEPSVSELPPGRDWESELQVGVHAGPSMNHLHIHVLSKEYMSDRGRTGRHYQTFKTPFFVNLDDFPLEKDDPRFGSLKPYLEQDLVCWRCQQSFGRRWKRLEQHLSEEFEKWRSE